MPFVLLKKAPLAPFTETDKEAVEMHCEIQVITASGIEIALRIPKIKSHLIESKALLRSTFSIPRASKLLVLYPFTKSVAKRTFLAKSLPGMKAD